MSESTPEPTTASDLQAGGGKPGTDYGASGGIGTQAEEQTGSAPADLGGSGGGGGSDLNEGGGGSDPNDGTGGSGEGGAGGAPAGGSDLNESGGGSDPNGPAVPDEAGAAEAQGGVNEAFSVAPQD